MAKSKKNAAQVNPAEAENNQREENMSDLHNAEANCPPESAIATSEAAAVPDDASGNAKPVKGKVKVKVKDDAPISRAECPEGGEAKTVELKSLTFDAAYQMRAELVNEDTALKYSELMADGVLFPPIYVADTGVKLVVFSGFNRGRAYELAKIKEVPVIVWKMTERDAKKWALRQNGSHGKTRTDRDIRKAINTLLDDADLLSEVHKSGGQRAIAAAVGVSNGALWRALEERGQTVRNGKLVKSEKKPEPKPEANTDGNTVANTDGNTVAETETEPTANRTPEELDDEHRAQLVAKLSDANMPKSIRSVAGNLIRLIESALTRPGIGAHFEICLEKKGIVAEFGDEFHPKTVRAVSAIMDAAHDLEEVIKGIEAERSFESAPENRPAQGLPTEPEPERSPAA
jgi:hypothetical protein